MRSASRIEPLIPEHEQLMSPCRTVFLSATLTLLTTCAVAAGADFSGTWSMDLRTTEQKAANAECGMASFVLKQTGARITGSHTFATAGCGRLNEGGEGTVKGRVVGTVAHLVVTSGRNGAVVKGVATLRNDALYWETKEEVSAGVQGDSPLILDKGLLTKASN